MTEIFETTAGGTRVWTNVADDEKFLLVAHKQRGSPKPTDGRCARGVGFLEKT
jgi:hypothetical protein